MPRIVLDPEGIRRYVTVPEGNYLVQIQVIKNNDHKTDARIESDEHGNFFRVDLVIQEPTEYAGVVIPERLYVTGNIRWRLVRYLDALGLGLDFHTLDLDDREVWVHLTVTPGETRAFNNVRAVWVPQANTPAYS